jgi:hydroxymethylpyrimidine kinase/phosphomethylpyrimidine kinase
MTQQPKFVLSIAGLDPSGGAGIIADLKTFAAFRCYGAAALTSVTFQNTQGVFGAESQSAASVRGQVAPIFDDFDVNAVKTGMLPTREIIDEIAAMAIEFGFRNLVVDPVVRSTSGFDLIDDAALKSLIEKLFPLASVVTPNAVEAERIVGFPIADVGDAARAARKMHDLGANAVLIKGGHLDLRQGGSATGVREAVDLLFIDGVEHCFSAEYFETTSTHGTGCTLAAAIAASLAAGATLTDAVGNAKRFVNEAIRTAPNIGKGHSPINHFAFDSER